MAYSTVVSEFEILGNLKLTFGKCTTDGTTGTLDVALGLCVALAVVPITAAKVVNITSALPCAGNAIGMGAEGSTDFYFIALGV